MTATDAERLATTRALVALERTTKRLRDRWPVGSVCRSCQTTNPLPFIDREGLPVCYRCTTGRETEEHSTAGWHLEPRVPTDPNQHRVLSEVDRICKLLRVPGLRTDSAMRISALVTIRLAALGSL